MKKRCTKCLKVLPPESFGPLKYECKSCASKRSTEWRNLNRERFREYQRKYWKQHPRDRRSYWRSYWQHLLSNPEKLEKRRKQQREAYRKKVTVNK